METDDNAASVPVPESHRILRHTSRDLPPSCLLLYSCLVFRIHGKRQAAVKLEGDVKPRMKLFEEDDLCVSNQLQSFREQFQENVIDHGAEGIGAHDVFFQRSQL